MVQIDILTFKFLLFNFFLAVLVLLLVVINIWLPVYFIFKNFFYKTNSIVCVKLVLLRSMILSGTANNPVFF